MGHEAGTNGLMTAANRVGNAIVTDNRPMAMLVPLVHQQTVTRLASYRASQQPGILSNLMNMLLLTRTLIFHRCVTILIAVPDADHPV